MEERKRNSVNLNERGAAGDYLGIRKAEAMVRGTDGEICVGQFDGAHKTCGRL
jgi:hypothetical protein